MHRELTERILTFLSTEEQEANTIRKGAQKEVDVIDDQNVKKLPVSLEIPVKNGAVQAHITVSNVL